VTVEDLAHAPRQHEIEWEEVWKGGEKPAVPEIGTAAEGETEAREKVRYCPPAPSAVLPSSADLISTSSCFSSPGWNPLCFASTFPFESRR